MRVIDLKKVYKGHLIIIGFDNKSEFLRKELYRGISGKIPDELKYRAIRFITPLNNIYTEVHLY